MFKPTCSENYQHIYSNDPAVDQKHPDFDPEKWAETGDGKWLPLRPGAEPVRFELRHLRGRAKAYLTDRQASGVGGASTLTDAVSLALVKIYNGIREDGSEFDVKTVMVKDARLSMADDDTIDTLYSVDNGSLIAELGLRIFKETFGNPT